jgi:hypothetical protein
VVLHQQVLITAGISISWQFLWVSHPFDNKLSRFRISSCSLPLRTCQDKNASRRIWCAELSKFIQLLPSRHRAWGVSRIVSRRRSCCNWFLRSVGWIFLLLWWDQIVVIRNESWRADPLLIVLFYW